MELNKMQVPPGSRTARRRIGRGIGSGWGKTSAKGTKGQNSRSGGGTKPGFEGGQMPLHRRLPRRGFKNLFATRYATVNLSTIEELGLEVVDLEALMNAGVLKTPLSGLKVLGDGELTRPVVVRAAKFTESARRKIEDARGRAEVVELG